MHSSGSANNKPRQRTFTSCTECRRRKQRCNQAKDRPCNNCIRRYPAVECVYEVTTPPAVPEHQVEDGDRSQSQYDQQVVTPLSHPMGDHTHSRITNPGYSQPPNTPYNPNLVSTSTADGYFPITYSSFPVPTSRPYYHSDNPETTSASSSGPTYVATSSAGDDYLMDDGGAYYGGTDPSYVGAYYGQIGQVNQSSWVTGQSDVASFTGTNANSTGDYYYGHVGDQHHVRTTRA